MDRQLHGGYPRFFIVQSYSYLLKLSMINIAFIIDTITSPTAGTEKQLLLLIERLDRNKFRPFLCVLHSSQWLTEEFDNCELFEIGFHSLTSLQSLRSVYHFSGWLRKKEIHIVQTFFVDANKVGIVAARIAGIKSVISSRRNQGYWLKRSELLQLRVLNRWVSVFLANSEDTRRWAADTEKLPLSRFEVIRNGLELDKFPITSKKLPADLQKDSFFHAQGPYIVVVANLREVKRIDTFLRAAQLVQAQCPHARFVIIGDGPLREDLEDLAQELGIGDKIRFLGKRQDVHAILPCMDLGVLPSSSESFSNSVIEYMAAALPVVCTEVGGAREAITDGVEGYVVPVGDYGAMAEKVVLLVSAENFSEVGLRGRQKIKVEFSIDKITREHENLYRAMTG